MLATINRRALLATALAGALTAAAPAWSADTFKVGAINPYSGATALYGTEVTRGYELAADALNAKGGLLGKQIEIVRGNATTPQEGIAAIEQLAGRDNVDVFIGTYLSAVSQAASEAALNYNKLYWDTNALAANLTERGLPNFVRSGPYSASFAQRSVSFITDLVAGQLGKKPSELKVWIEHEDSIYGTSIAKQQEEELKKAGVQVVGVGAHSYKAIDLTDSVLRAKNAQPDVWLQTGYVPDGNLLLRTARDQGFKPAATVFVGTGDTNETLEAMGKDGMEGLYVVSYPRPDISEKFGPGSSAYLAAYKAKYNQDPVAPQSMAAYVGFQMMAEAVAAAGSADPAAVKAVLPKFDKPESSYATGFGVKYDEHAQNTRAFPTVIQWQSGKQVTIYPVAAAGDHKPVMPGK
jgi:branched-chain amino acid transport system substrate-binding protein